MSTESLQNLLKEEEEIKKNIQKLESYANTSSPHVSSYKQSDYDEAEWVAELAEQLRKITLEEQILKLEDLQLKKNALQQKIMTKR